MIEWPLDQLSYGIFSDLLRSAQNKKASPKTNKKPYIGGGKLRGKLDHASSALPRPSFLLGLDAGSKSDWLSVTFLKGWGHIRFTVGNKLVVEGGWQGGARLSYLRWERPMVIQATSPRKSFRAFKFLPPEAPQRTRTAWLTWSFSPCKSPVRHHGDVPSETVGKEGGHWHAWLLAAAHLDASTFLARSKLLTHFYIPSLAPFQGQRHIPCWARNGRTPSRCRRLFWSTQSEVSLPLPASPPPFPPSACACACAERGARGCWAAGWGALGSAESPLAVCWESRAAVNTRIPAGACEHGGIARSGQAHGRLSGTPPPPQPPPPPPPLPPQPAAARAQQPWPKTTGTGACGELEEKEVARPHPGPPPQAPPRRPRGSEVTRAPPPVSVSSILRVGAALPREPAGP